MTQFTRSRSTTASRIAGVAALILLAVLAAAPWWASSSFRIWPESSRSIWRWPRCGTCLRAIPASSQWVNRPMSVWAATVPHWAGPDRHPRQRGGRFVAGHPLASVKHVLYILVAGLTAMIGSLISLQKLRVSPDAAFSVNDWTAFVIFIVVIGGIGTIEGPILGTVVYFLLRKFLSDCGTICLLLLGSLAIVVMLTAPKGLWGYAAEGSLFPVGYCITFPDCSTGSTTD